jgi:hypothetical protein
LSYQPYLDQLIAFASTEERKPDLLAAKAEYFQRTGEVFEDDKQFEMRMASFLDHYLFDRQRPGSGRPRRRSSSRPARRWKTRERSPRSAASPRRCTACSRSGRSSRRGAAAGAVRGKEFDVSERRHTVGLEKGDILEARLIPFDGALVFSSAFCFHPREAVKAIKKEVKRRKKVMPEAPAVDLTWEASKRALKADRYRQIAVDKIYDFEGSRL